MSPADFPVLGLILGASVFALNLAFGRLRWGASRRSSHWFACLAAPMVLVAAVRSAAALPWAAAWPLLLPAILGQVVGRRWQAGPAPSPARWRFAVYGTLLGGLLVFIGPPLGAYGGHPAHHGGHPAQIEDDGYTRLEANEPAPGFSLVDEDGRTISLAGLRGQVVVLTFFYSTCTDVCPILIDTLQRAEDALDAGERERVRFVAITVDPVRDTGERLKEFRSERGLEGGSWSLLTGSLPALAGVAADYGVVVRPAPGGDLVHNSVFVIIDPAGNLRAELHGVAAPVEAVLADIRQAMR